LPAIVAHIVDAMSVYRITDYGAEPNGSANNAAAIQAAVDAAASAGGGTVVVPAGGVFLAGSFELASNVTLHLEPGSVVLASPDIGDYGQVDRSLPRQQSATDTESITPEKSHYWIRAADAENVAVTGTGTIDGNAEAFVAEKRKKNWVARNPRARALSFFRCRRVCVRDIAIRNTPSWALHPCGCDDVLIDGITIDNSLKLVNTDGIDPDCSRNVRISNCRISTGDDGIVLKACREWAPLGPCENITITGCVIRSTCTAIKIGTESHADIRNVTVSNCVIHDSSRGLAIDGRDAGTTENILFSDIVIGTRLFDPVWWSKSEPIYIAPLPRPGSEVAPGPLRNVCFRNILCRGENGVYVHGWAEGHPPRGLVFDNVRVELGHWTRWTGGTYDPRPTPPDLAPADSTGLRERTPWGSLAEHRNAGFFLEGLEDVTLRHCRVEWLEPADRRSEWFIHALEGHAVHGLEISYFRGQAAQEGMEAIALKGCRDVRGVDPKE
jgi:hypothetical protein